MSDERYADATMNSWWKDRRVLVTGGAGFVGANLCRALIDRGAIVHGYDLRRGPSWDVLALPKDRLIYGNTEDPWLVQAELSACGIEVVFHLAGMGHIKECQEQPLSAWVHNIKGTWGALEACRMMGEQIKAVVVASSNHIYGAGEGMNEWAAFDQSDVYGTSKACFSGKALVLTAEGSKRIKDIRPGDLVWTHHGRLRSVLSLHNRPFRGSLVHFRFKYSINTQVGATPEHQVLTSTGWRELRHLSVGDKITVRATRCRGCGMALPAWRTLCSHDCPGTRDERVLQTLRGRQMTMPERYLDALFQSELPGILRWVGDGQAFIAHLCPDWIHRDRKLLIEYAGRFYSEPRLQQKLDRYAEQGWSAIGLTERDFRLPEEALKKVRTLLSTAPLLPTYSVEELLPQSPNIRSAAFEFVDVPIQHIWTGLPHARMRVWNLEIEEDESYIVNNVVVHNCADLIARSYGQTLGVPTAALRHVNCFGPADPHSSHLVTGAICDLLEQKAPLIHSDGTPRKGYLHVEDVISAYLLLGQRLVEGTIPMGQGWNAAPLEPISVADLVNLVIEVSGRSSAAVVLKEDLSQSGYLEHLRSLRLRNLGWVSTPLNLGLRATWNWYEAKGGMAWAAS